MKKKKKSFFLSKNRGFFCSFEQHSSGNDLTRKREIKNLREKWKSLVTIGRKHMDLGIYFRKSELFYRFPKRENKLSRSECLFLFHFHSSLSLWTLLFSSLLNKVDGCSYFFVNIFVHEQEDCVHKEKYVIHYDCENVDRRVKTGENAISVAEKALYKYTGQKES